MVILSIFAFLCPPMWSHDENVDCPHLYQVIMGSYTLIVGVLKYFLILGILSALILILWFFRPMVFLSIFCFSLSVHVITWWEFWLSTPVPGDHGIVHLDSWSIKIFSHFWGFCTLWSDTLVLSFYGVFVHFYFSLSAHVISWREWRECWFSTTVSGDHGIVHLDFWSIKIFSHFWGLCPLLFW